MSPRSKSKSLPNHLLKRMNLLRSRRVRLKSPRKKNKLLLMIKRLRSLRRKMTLKKRMRRRKK